MAKKTATTEPAAGRAADAPKPSLLQSGPRVIAPRQAPVFHLPDVVKAHYSELFPHLAPQQDPENPGVWINYDGTPYTPRERKGGQFSALLVIAANKFVRSKTREIALPLSKLDKPDEWGVKPHEVIQARHEVVFDFEEQLREFLAAFGGDEVADPLKAQMQRQHKWAAAHYDDVNATPGMAPQPA